MKVFFRSFILSLTRPSYYKAVLHARPSFSVKYYAVLSLLLIIIITIAGIVTYAPTTKADFAQISQELVQDFPPDLVLDIKPQGISANRVFPLIAQLPSPFSKNGTGADLPKNLVILDPNGEVGMLQKYDSLILINNNYMIVGNGDTVQTAPLKDFPETRVDFAKMQQLANAALFISKNAVLFVGLASFVSGLLNFFVARPVYLLVFAFGLWLVNRTAVGSFSGAFKVGVHTFTLPILISTTLEVTGVNIPIPGWFVIVHAVFAFFVLSRLEKPTQN